MPNKDSEALKYTVRFIISRIKQHALLNHNLKTNPEPLIILQNPYLKLVTTHSFHSRPSAPCHKLFAPILKKSIKRIKRKPVNIYDLPSAAKRAGKSIVSNSMSSKASKGKRGRRELAEVSSELPEKERGEEEGSQGWLTWDWGFGFGFVGGLGCSMRRCCEVKRNGV